MKYFIVCLLFIVNCKAESQLAYHKAFSYIVNDDHVVEFFSVKEKNSFMVSEKPIPFNLISISESLISQNHIEGYSIFQELTNAQRSLEEAVIDSLERVEKKANMTYNEESTIQIKKALKRKKGDLTIFFSETFDRSLYVEVLQTEAVKLGYKMAYGEALSYLFVFDENNDIKEVFKGSIHHN